MDAPLTTHSEITRMRAGSTYLNIHTRRNPGGELRGQVGPGRRE
ncbi:MAG: CHRD domain-containing protein [Gemmatimonas sp.]